jgi:hypothetical protein
MRQAVFATQISRIRYLNSTCDLFSVAFSSNVRGMGATEPHSVQPLGEDRSGNQLRLKMRNKLKNHRENED